MNCSNCGERLFTCEIEGGTGMCVVCQAMERERRRREARLADAGARGREETI